MASRLRKGESSRELWAEIAAHTRSVDEGDKIGIFGNKQVKGCSKAERSAFPCVNNWNMQQLRALPEPIVQLTAIDRPTPDGNVASRLPKTLMIKHGCVVMMTKNVYEQSTGLMRFANGSIGTVVAIEPDVVRVRVQLEKDVHTEIDVERVVVRKAFMEHGHEQTAEREQFPLRVAHGFTIHAAQGKTIHEKHTVQASQFWASGMGYVALSRASKPSLIRLKDLPTSKWCAPLCPRVQAYYRQLRSMPLPDYAR